MRLIKPSEISARILTLLDESDERVIIVSPYMRISKWYKLMNKIKGLKTRNIVTELYVRDDPDNIATYRDLDGLALEYTKIPNLHSKLYLNERYGIVTSMNLLLSSDINSLEIGYATETFTEYNDMLHYYHRYIHSGEPVDSDTKAGRQAADLNEFMRNISEELNKSAKNSWLWLDHNVLHVSTGRSNCIVSINDGYLRITACLRIASTTKPKSFQPSELIIKKIGNLTNMKINMYPGSNSDPNPGSEPGIKPYILQLSGQAQHTLRSTCIAGVLEAEAAYIIESVSRFIDAIDNLVF